MRKKPYSLPMVVPCPDRLGRNLFLLDIMCYLSGFLEVGAEVQKWELPWETLVSTRSWDLVRLVSHSPPHPHLLLRTRHSWHAGLLGLKRKEGH